MSLSQFIRNNTNDGADIASVLIDVMNGRIDGSKVGHRLTAARLLIIYGHDDADDFIADNTPITSEKDPDDRVWVIIDPALTKLIRFKTDDGRAMCLFLIEVMQGKVEGINVGHRVSAARELLNRAFGRYQSRPLPKPPGSTGRSQSTHKITPAHQRVPSTRLQGVTTTSAVSTAVLDAPEQQTEPEASDVAPVHTDTDDPLYIDEERLQFYEACYDDNFDPYEAARNPDYAQSYTNCPDPECEVHGDPPEIDFDPSDYFY